MQMKIIAVCSQLQQLKKKQAWKKKKKKKKNSGLNGNRTRDLCDTSAALLPIAKPSVSWSN